jgi:hypothetical protein
VVTAVAPDRLLTRPQAARRLGVGTATVDRWYRAGLLAAVGRPGGRRYLESGVDQARYRRDHGGWCPDCDYQFTAAGHRIECGDGWRTNRGNAMSDKSKIEWTQVNGLRGAERGSHG